MRIFLPGETALKRVGTPELNKLLKTYIVFSKNKQKKTDFGNTEQILNKKYQTFVR